MRVRFLLLECSAECTPVIFRLRLSGPDSPQCAQYAADFYLFVVPYHTDYDTICCTHDYTIQEVEEAEIDEKEWSPEYVVTATERRDGGLDFQLIFASSLSSEKPTTSKEVTPIPLQFNLTVPVFYMTNTEYRAQLRQFFQMDVAAKRQDLESLDLDDVSMDECLFDNTHVSGILETVYQETKDHPWFHALYLKMAGYFVSTDVMTGVTVLFAYDWFKYFYPCLHEYVENRESWTPEWPHARTLASKIR